MRATQNGLVHQDSPGMGPNETPRTIPTRKRPGWGAIMACALWGSIMATAYAEATLAEGPGTGIWTVIRGNDPLLDTPTIIATLPATPVPDKPQLQPTLRIACTDGILSSSIRWGERASGAWSGQTPKGIDVLVRFGQEAPEWRRWRQIENTAATELDEPWKFITVLGSHSTLALRAYPSGSTPTTVVFNLSDAEDLMTEVTDACKAFARQMETLTLRRAELRTRAEGQLEQIRAEITAVETERQRIEAPGKAQAERRKQTQAEQRQAETEQQRIGAEKRQGEAQRKRREAQESWTESERRLVEARKRWAEEKHERTKAAKKRAEAALQEQIAEDARQLEKERLAVLDGGRMKYIAQIKDKIERNWLRPPGTASGLKCVVRVSQIPGGEVVQAEIRTSSGNVAFDRSVEDAVLRSSPLPVPKDPSLFDRHVTITFEPEAGRACGSTSTSAQEPEGGDPRSERSQAQRVRTRSTGAVNATPRTDDRHALRTSAPLHFASGSGGFEHIHVLNRGR